MPWDDPQWLQIEEQRREQLRKELREERVLQKELDLQLGAQYEAQHPELANTWDRIRAMEDLSKLEKTVLP